MKGKSRIKTPDHPYRADFADGRIYYYRTARLAAAAKRGSDRRYFKKRNIQKKKTTTSSVIAKYATDKNQRDWRVNPSEAAFLGYAKKTSPNAKILRGGWPDFLMIDEDGSLCCVEVKSWANKLRSNQLACIKALELVGVQTLIFRSNLGDVVSWRKFINDRLEANHDAGYRHRHSVLRKAPQTLVECDEEPGESELRPE